MVDLPDYCSLLEADTYRDLLFYQNTLDSNDTLDTAAREQRWNERLRWEQMDEAARRSQWQTSRSSSNPYCQTNIRSETVPENQRMSLGLENSHYSRLYESPDYFERRLNTGYDQGYLHTG